MAIETTALTGQPPGDCILFATADWDTPYWTNKQHTAVHLAKAGWRVLYVESVGLRTPKVGSGTDWRRIIKRLWRGLRGPRQVEERIWVYSPLVIPFRHDHPWVRKFNQGWLSHTVGRFIRRHRFSQPMVWTYHPYVLETKAWLDRHPATRTGHLVYHCVDDLAAIPGIDSQAFLKEERSLLAQADAVFTTSHALHEKCSAHNANVLNTPNVVDFGHFAQAHEPGVLPPELANVSRPRLVYVGALSDFKVNFSLLREVAMARPSWQVILIGSEREGQRDAELAKLAELPNVHMLGHRPYEQLPALLAFMDVGLLPTHVNEYTRSMFPMKYFEYLAAGLPVVSTPLAFTRDHDAGLEVADSASEFVGAVEAQLAHGRFSLEQSRQLVGEHTWEARLVSMLTSVRGKRQNAENTQRTTS